MSGQTAGSEAPVPDAGSKGTADMPPAELGRGKKKKGGLLQEEEDDESVARTLEESRRRRAALMEKYKAQNG